VAEDVTLLVNGKQHFGWEDVSIKRSIRAISGAFSLSVTSKWAEEQKPFLINPGDECKLMLGSDQVIQGYVDETNPKYDANSRSFGVSGRDKSGDIVDCSTELHQLTNITLFEMVKKVCKPFGITAIDKVKDSKRFSTMVTPGEAGFEALEKAAKLRGILLTNDGQGNVVLTRAGTTKSTTELVEGVNILDADARYDVKQRFSKVTAKAQSFGNPEDGPDPLVDFVPKGVSLDPEIKRYRPLLIVADGAADAQVCKDRAKWEVTVRAAKSTVVNVTVQGWRQGDGRLWTVNELVRVRSPFLGIDVDLLLTETTFSKSNSGTLTKMQLVPAAAYSFDPTLLSKKEPWRQLVLKESKR